MPPSQSFIALTAPGKLGCSTDDPILLLVALEDHVDGVPLRTRNGDEGIGDYLGDLALLLGTTSIVLSFIDVSRYGQSAWSFFDIQIILVTVCGLIGGLGTAGTYAFTHAIRLADATLVATPLPGRCLLRGMSSVQRPAHPSSFCPPPALGMIARMNRN